MNHNMFSCYPFPPPNTLPKVEAQEGMSYFMENKQPPLFDIPKLPFQAPLPYFRPEFYQNHQKMFAQKPNNQMLFENYTGNQNTQMNNSFSEDLLPFALQKFHNYSFIQCIC